MRISDERTDRIYRDVLGWPIPRKPETPVEIIADLRSLLAERRRQIDARHPKVEVPRG